MRKLQAGWNTWNIRSVLAHVLLPEGFAVSLGLKVYSSGRCLTEALIGRKNKREEHIVPGPHAYDGSYTSLELEWDGASIKVETAVEAGDWYALVTPLEIKVKAPSLSIAASVLWNRAGKVWREGDRLFIDNDHTAISVQATGTHCNDEPVVELNSPYLLVTLDSPVMISTNPERLSDAESVIGNRRQAFIATREGMRDAHNAMQTCLAWDTIYDPFKDRVISPVSRIWSCSAGGWTLFDWDTYFAAWMAGAENKALAYANAIAITEEATENGFIPNCAHPGGYKSRDRSQPPVGAITVRALCDMFSENDLAERLFDALLQWNRWWPEHRDMDGYLCWGSDPYEPLFGTGWETIGVNKRLGAAFESGLDNSPMYDDVPFDTDKHLLMLADVGLMSLYIADCQSLADLAERIGRKDVIEELNARTEKYSIKLKSMWNEENGMFLNRNLVTGDYCKRLSPTHFYPLIAKVATAEQAARMIDEHFFNPDEFWGEWMLPSIARNDPAYPDQEYWRGRIWAPMNFLVYLGLTNYELPEARKALVEKSEKLLLKEWTEKGHVHENYHGDTGVGCDVASSDAFYHWGGLLGLISVLDQA